MSSSSARDTQPAGATRVAVSRKSRRGGHCTSLKMTAVSTRLRAIARQTVTIVQDGRYRSPAGHEVDLAGDITAAVEGTRMYAPGDLVSVPAPGCAAPAIEVTSETSLHAARRLGGTVACLVFASAKNPGGGFRTGAQAQEESIARASALHVCLESVPEFYSFHRQQRDLRYSDRVIYSPAVPVFRDDKGSLLEEPYPVSFLTSAAPNLGAILRNQPGDAGTVPDVLAARAGRCCGSRRLAATGLWYSVRGAAACSATTLPRSPPRSPTRSHRPADGSTESCFPSTTARPGPRPTRHSPAPLATEPRLQREPGWLPDNRCATSNPDHPDLRAPRGHFLRSGRRA